MTPSRPPAAPPTAPAAAATSWGVATTAPLLASTGGVPWTPGLLGLTSTPDQDTSSHLFLNLPHCCPFSYSILFSPIPSSFSSLLTTPLSNLPSLFYNLRLLTIFFLLCLLFLRIKTKRITDLNSPFKETTVSFLS